MNTVQLIEKLKSAPETVTFNQVIETITSDYNYSPARFSNGSGETMAVNESGSNEGSCKIFAFAQLNNLNEKQTLQCFGDYYRKDVLENPEGTDHANIRNFIIHGWKGIHFDSAPLSEK